MQKLSFALPFPTGRFHANNKKKFGMLQLYSFCVCMNTCIGLSLDLWLSSFSFPFPQICTDTNIPYGYGCVLFWLSSTVLCSHSSHVVLMWMIYLLRQYILSRETRVHQPTARCFLSTLETVISPWARWKPHWKFRRDSSLIQISWPCNSFSAGSSSTSTNTHLEAPFKAWVCFCPNQKLLSGWFSLWHQSRASGGNGCF